MDYSPLVHWACGKLPLEYPATLHLTAAVQCVDGEQHELARRQLPVAAPPAVPVSTDDLLPWVQDLASQCAQLMPARVCPLCLCLRVSWVPVGRNHGFRVRLEVGVDASGQTMLAPFAFDAD